MWVLSRGSRHGRSPHFLLSAFGNGPWRVSSSLSIRLVTSVICNLSFILSSRVLSYTSERSDNDHEYKYVWIQIMWILVFMVIGFDARGWIRQTRLTHWPGWTGSKHHLGVYTSNKLTSSEQKIHRVQNCLQRLKIFHKISVVSELSAKYIDYRQLIWECSFILWLGVSIRQSWVGSSKEKKRIL